MGKQGLKTYRVRGIPADWDREQLRNFLDTSVGDQAKVYSFATEIYKNGKKTATVMFKGDPEHENPWNIPIPPTNSSLVLDDGFVGITTLYCPSEDNHQVNIVGISGVGGHAFGSFKDKTSDDYMWLRDALPEGIPGARILIYGYESAIANSQSMQNIEDIAKSFYNSILQMDSEKPPKPTIFLAHSLGGLVVKQAYVMLSKSTRDNEIKLFQSMSGLVFFGVPHQGMDITSLRSMAGDGPNRSFIESLNSENSQVLNNLQSDFKTALEKKTGLGIVCFYETLQSPTAELNNGKYAMTGPPKVLVSMPSATSYGDPDAGRGVMCAINRTHSEMVKFGRSENDYEIVLGRIRDLISQAKTGISSFLNNATGSSLGFIECGVSRVEHGGQGWGGDAILKSNVPSNTRVIIVATPALPGSSTYKVTGLSNCGGFVRAYEDDRKNKKFRLCFFIGGLAQGNSLLVHWMAFAAGSNSGKLPGVDDLQSNNTSPTFLECGEKRVERTEKGWRGDVRLTPSVDQKLHVVTVATPVMSPRDDHKVKNLSHCGGYIRQYGDERKNKEMLLRYYVDGVDHKKSVGVNWVSYVYATASNGNVPLKSQKQIECGTTIVKRYDGNKWRGYAKLQTNFPPDRDLVIVASPVLNETGGGARVPFLSKTGGFIRQWDDSRKNKEFRISYYLSDLKEHQSFSVQWIACLAS